eukprot:3549236-Rhodomonas_salina.2
MSVPDFAYQARKMIGKRLPGYSGISTCTPGISIRCVSAGHRLASQWQDRTAHPTCRTASGQPHTECLCLHLAVAKPALVPDTEQRMRTRTGVGYRWRGSR